MNLTPLIAAADSGISPLYVLGYVFSALVGFAVAWFGGFLRSSDQVKSKLDEAAKAVVQEKFDALSNGLRFRIDTHDERLTRIEKAVEAFVRDRHQQDMALATQLAAMRLFIAEHSATKEQVNELAKRMGELALQLSQAFAAQRSGGTK